MKAVVLGGTGGSGEAIVIELLARGIETIAVGRSEVKLNALARTSNRSGLLSTVVADASQTEALIPMFETADIVFHAANVPYHRMAEKLLPLGESVMRAAEETGVKVVFVDGVYVYGRNPGHRIDETFPHNAHTKKGRLKADLAQLVFSNRWRRAEPLIVRLPDYYGPTSKLAYLNPTLEGLVQGKPTIFFGNRKVQREYVFLPDAADMIVEIALRDDSYHETWNIPGCGTISGDEIIELAREITGKRSFVIPITRFTVRLIGIFDRFFREIVEIYYLMEDPVILSGEKYASRIGPIVATPYKEGIGTTLHALKQ